MSKVFTALRLVEKGSLSLTNICLYASIAKAVFSTPSLADWALVTSALIAYNFKRWLETKQTNTEQFEARFVALENSVNTIRSAITLRK